MTPLPGALGGSQLIAWRLDRERFAPTWDSGEGAFQVGGRWNSKGVRAVYSALDPATAILEVAVHIGFNVLDAQPHVLTGLHVVDMSNVHVVRPADIPNFNWLRPGLPSTEQQAFGDALLAEHQFAVIPSVVSTHSWNLIFDPAKSKGAYRRSIQEPFALDPRLHPPT